MSVLETVLADLTAEGDALRAAVAGLDEAGWATPTPAEGWSVATTIAHLRWTDECAVLATAAHTTPGKRAWDDLVLKAIEDPDGFVDKSAHALAALPPADLLQRWDEARLALTESLRAFPAGDKLPWFGPPMSPTSMATARFMETWAHALDVYDALGSRPAPTDRIRHVAHIGVRTRDFSFAGHGLEPPTEEFRIELTAPSGQLWTWGAEDAPQRVTGSAYDFCELVTQRVHRDDTDLFAIGVDAERWLEIAQAFAGPAGPGRAPR
ncbi:TIGR03084 family protein [Nocardioides sp. zg-536]|uniref:TIGR03084 family protein n=1 Tax=Nocardioides faecalis TaxID=2803858 RepID=A0A938Y8L5_9ACTN|nr:TIGR03084 family metal-binding protein [Nocardioides faecalis]MBM9459855.1 TIGR03084 family protein [Nocardioides faecalis]MBS4754486.1 TIGR03084 family protein [Nocardioides faecalis]QVI58906.1 TIGR03084 family protein [Nocardioides faecalis]